ncbi:hypothetical protein [Vibrio parahaemolyticus]|uniref:hypothetical protein n=1 Tax=Vibrio parahaemolyticus TaxID=670 RepID=UPI0006C4C573|nr:hypothetical protein ACX10_03225 [Vibrio parahaemolyticus]
MKSLYIHSKLSEDNDSKLLKRLFSSNNKNKLEKIDSEENSIYVYSKSPESKYRAISYAVSKSYSKQLDAHFILDFDTDADLLFSVALAASRNCANPKNVYVFDHAISATSKSHKVNISPYVSFTSLLRSDKYSKTTNQWLDSFNSLQSEFPWLLTENEEITDFEKIEIFKNYLILKSENISSSYFNESDESWGDTLSDSKSIYLIRMPSSLENVERRDLINPMIINLIEKLSRINDLKIGLTIYGFERVRNHQLEKLIIDLQIQSKTFIECDVVLDNDEYNPRFCDRLMSTSPEIILDKVDEVRFIKNLNVPYLFTHNSIVKLDKKANETEESKYDKSTIKESKLPIYDPSKAYLKLLTPIDQNEVIEL